MGGALGDLKSITAGSSPLQGELAQRGRKMISSTAPIRKEAFSQLLAAMQGGKVAGRIPMIQQAVSQSNQASAMAQRQTAEGLAQRNVGGPFAASALGQLRQQGLQQSAAIPTQMSQQLINQYLPFAGATQQMGMGAFSTAAQSQQQLAEFNASQRQQSSLQGGGGLFGGIIGCLDPEVQIDAPDGPIQVEQVLPGDCVYSLDAIGNKIEVKVIETRKMYVGENHIMVRVYSETGSFLVSPIHPDHNGEPIDRRFSEYEFLSTDYTCDIRVEGPTGTYFVDGFPLGSTLD